MKRHFVEGSVSLRRSGFKVHAHVSQNSTWQRSEAFSSHARRIRPDPDDFVEPNVQKKNSKVICPLVDGVSKWSGGRTAIAYCGCELTG